MEVYDCKLAAFDNLLVEQCLVGLPEVFES